AGTLKADANANTIENFNATGPVTFTNDGELWVTGSSTTLTLLNDVLNDYVGTIGGLIQVDGTGAGATLELQHTTIDGGTHGVFSVAARSKPTPTPTPSRISMPPARSPS